MGKFIRACGWLKQEIIHAIPAILFFMVAFNIVVLTNNLMLAPEDLHYAGHLEATFFALVIAKLIIIMNVFSFINLFPHRPLIYNICWKTLLYSLGALILRPLENLVHLMLKHVTFATAINDVKVQVHTPLFWSVQIWLCALLFVYVVFSEFAHALGPHTVRRMLFG